MTKDDGVSSTSDVVMVGIPVSSAGGAAGIIDIPLTAISKGDNPLNAGIITSAGFTASGILGSESVFSIHYSLTRIF